MPFVSVVVAARNEEKRIEGCLKALISQSYSASAYEIIVVNDQSDDTTAEIVKSVQKYHQQLKLVHISHTPGHISPKKHAVGTGIRQAAGEIILLTDADCLPPSDWITCIVRWYTPGVNFVAGLSPVILPPSRGFTAAFLLADSLVLGMLAAGSLSSRYPLTCSARNLSYRKQVFIQADGFGPHQQVPSGDDDLFMHHLRGSGIRGFQYAISPRAVVPTSLETTWSGFVHQRLRHGSKFKWYPRYIQAFSLFMFGYQLLFLLAIEFLLFFPAPLLLIPLAMKFAFDGMILRAAEKIFEVPVHRRWLPIISLLYPLYITMFGILGIFKGFRWKGRDGSNPV